MTSDKRLDFGADADRDADPRFLMESYRCGIGTMVRIWLIIPKIVDELLTKIFGGL